MKIIFDCENPACEKWWEEDAELFDSPDEGRGIAIDCFCPHCGQRPSNEEIEAKIEAALEPAEPDWSDTE